MHNAWRDQQEWLETDGLGGFASGTVGGIRTRRYHGLLMCATHPPTGRYLLVNGVEAFVTTPAGTFPLSTQRYQPDVVCPEGCRFIEAFDIEPWPTWRFRLPDGTLIEHELFVRHGQPTVALSWRLVESAGRAHLTVRPLLSGRDYHALHHENPNFGFKATPCGKSLCWRAYDGVPGVAAQSNGTYAPEPLWYRQFLYQQEWLRGFDATEDLASPGRFAFDLSHGEATLLFSAFERELLPVPSIDLLRDAELKRRKRFASTLHRSADQYLVRRGSGGKTIIAGYPWFTDWGRDTFISLRGLCLATGRLHDAAAILSGWAGHVSHGMLPNRFPDQGDEPEYNSVDASLWYVIAVCEFLEACERSGESFPQRVRRQLIDAADAILTGYAAGARHGIALDEDGLLRCGEPGVQLTWMDARVGDRVITPRIGKPVEIQALWLNAIWLFARHVPTWERLGERGAASFHLRFWNAQKGYLNDVVDDNHAVGAIDATLRPNQVFAVGGLPLMLVDLDKARRIVDVVERHLLTPMGLRSLAPDHSDYVAHYTGGPAQRDAAYHQGTAWPWLIGPFVEAWVRVRGGTAPVRDEARRRFIEPMLKSFDEAGLGHLSEIADAEAPHMPRGCPFQAWSIAELIRLEQTLFAEQGAKPAIAPVHPTGVQ
jgi:predicted glycogen debranching enzyme